MNEWRCSGLWSRNPRMGERKERAGGSIRRLAWREGKEGKAPPCLSPPLSASPHLRRQRCFLACEAGNSAAQKGERAAGWVWTACAIAGAAGGGAIGDARIPGGIWGWRPTFPGSSGAGSAESRTAILAPAPTPAPEEGGSARLWVCAKPWSKSASGVALVRNKPASWGGGGRSQTHSVGSLLIYGRQLQAYPRDNTRVDVRVHGRTSDR